jgi:hypothetical protein
VQKPWWALLVWLPSFGVGVGVGLNMIQDTMKMIGKKNLAKIIKPRGGLKIKNTPMPFQYSFQKILTEVDFTPIFFTPLFFVVLYFTCSIITLIIF